jgi:hypothetical protein
MMARLSRPIVLVAAALAVTAGGARADWIVTTDGARLETKGPWKVEGRRIVFTLPNGVLSAMRAEEVDLDQSALVTQEAAEAARRAAEPKVEPKREPVFRLTEKDIPPSPGGPEEPGDGTAAEGGETAAPAPAAAALEVASWEKAQNAAGDGVDVFGTIRNGTRVNITSPSVMAMIYGPDGGLLATAEGTVNSGAIGPTGSANFRVSFPGVPDFTAIKFDVQGRGFKTQSPEGEGEAEEPPADDSGS